MPVENPSVYPACYIDQCTAVQEQMNNDISKRAVPHVCRLVGTLVEGQGLISTDRGDVNPDICPMKDFLALDEETRSKIMPTIDDLKFVKSMIDGGVF